MKTNLYFVAFFMLFSFGLFAQANSKKPTTISTSEYMRKIPALSSMDNIISAKSMEHVAPPKRRGSNRNIEGKGLPVGGGDPFYGSTKNTQPSMRLEPPVASFDAHIGTVLNDPTGAIGPNHYVYAFNSGFGILDRQGNVLVPEASLATIFPGESLGDPIVVYDNFADRFIIMEFSNTPNGFLIAVSQGPDPVNSGWYTYRFNTGSFPDYEKLSIWSDGYYITANKDQNSPSTNDVVFAVNRDQMLAGEATAQLIGFPLPGARNSGFYSPGGSHATGTTLPPVGVGHSILFLQDDAWSGVGTDHIKIWTTDVDWSNPSNSSISQPQELVTTPFDSVFDNGSFQNLDEPGNGPDIDAIQSTMMYMTNYRRFGTHNSMVLNFVVDLDGRDSLAGIRWYELRQTADGAPWTIYQEGTYVQPDGLSAFCGSIAQDAAGNIGLGYTVVSSSVFTSLRYTGRLATDPLGTMTAVEQVSANGDSRTNRPDGRYGDYAQITIDPLDDRTFWFISEYMKGPSPNVRRSHVVAFKMEPAIPDDEAPTAPTNLVASNTTARQTTLSWGAATDNVRVTAYDVYRDGVVVATVTDTITTITGLTPETTYEFSVIAKDASGNLSVSSNTVRVTTLESTTGPGCVDGIVAPYSQSFENGIGAWTQATEDDLDWTVDSDGTPSNNTGPSSAVNGASYIYVEASGNGVGYPDKQAIITSPCLDLNNLASAEFSFQYHMFGAGGAGTLSLEASNDEGVNWTSIWSISGNQGNSWKSVTLNLADYLGSGLQLRFNRVTGDTWRADVAIDNVQFTTGSTGPGDGCAQGDVVLEITLDNYPQETSWRVEDENGNVVASETYSAANPDGSTVIETISGLASGNYTFAIFDTVGDGICCGYGNGSYTLSSDAGVIVTGGDFGDSETTSFCIEGSKALKTYPLSGLKDQQEDTFKIFPNPVVGVLNVELGGKEIDNVQIFSMYGQLVKEIMNQGSKQQIDVSDLSMGTYFVRFTSEKEELQITRKFVIGQ